MNRGRLCPKGAASKQLVTSPTRQTRGSATLRFAVFDAGVQSARDPRYTVIPPA